MTDDLAELRNIRRGLSIAEQEARARRECPFLIVLSDGMIETASDAACRMFGHIDGGLAGSSVHDLVPERLRSAHRAHFAKFWTAPSRREMGQGIAARLLGRRRDGTEFAVAISLAPWRDERDGILRVWANVMPLP